MNYNPELAEKYSTRTVRLLDGEIKSDSNPYTEKEEKSGLKKHKKISMSFGTALSLSFNNLRTKKGRTLLTSFAGSIGIIGIALILALSTGMNAYISDVQRDTMASYPITISSETLDISGVMGMRAEVIGERRNETGTDTSERSGVFVDYSELENEEKMSANVVKNNLTDFKKYLDNPSSDIRRYLGENGIVYSYDMDFTVYSHDSDNKLVSSADNPDEKENNSVGGRTGILDRLGSSNSSDNNATDFSELTVGSGADDISRVITDNYDVLYGSWPKNYNEVVLVLNQDNSISAETLYRLGLITQEQYKSASDKIESGKNADEISFSYKDFCNKTLYLVPACDQYIKNKNGTYSLIDDGTLNEKELLKNAIELKISGIIRPKEDASDASISTAVAYTSKLTDYVIKHTDESAVVKAQEADPKTNVLTGMKFESPDDKAKASDAKKYLSNLGISEKASFYKLMMYYSDSQSSSGTIAANDESAMAAALDLWLEKNPDQEILLNIYDEYIAGSTYEDNLKAFGKVSYDAPSSISIYTDSFENKDSIANCIESYNETADEDSQITYTDYVAMLTSSITTIINSISYVLIAFVAISLIVSCIMIGIITHISVMERTKEIGILRALGASKRNISQVFNAETFIIGCCAGLLGIGVSLLALIPINAIIEKLTGLTGLTAQLTVQSSVILIAISILITILGGLVPAKKAAKKDPVIALRTE